MPEGSSKNSGLSPGTIFFILALFGVGTPLMLSTTRPTPPAVVSSENASVTSDENSAVRLLEQFFNAPGVLSEITADTDKAPIYPGLNEKWRPNDPRCYDRISFLIATLPNPENPSLRYEFDRYSDSIQLALSHENYFLAKSYLPWTGQSAAKDGANGTPPEHSGRPGVMLFRRADSQSGDLTDTQCGDLNDRHPARDSLMVVFVVGETPTEGVDAAALRSALDQVARLCGWIGADAASAPAHLVELTRYQPYEIKIIGPSYSGSATSIQEVLRSWIYFDRLPQSAPPISISLLSGSATAIETWPEDLGAFRSTQLPQSQINEGIVHFFHNYLRNPRIAILTDDTDYGNSIAMEHPAERQWQALAKIGDDHGRFPVGVTLLPYPIHISNVRTTFANLQLANPATTQLGFAHRDPSVSDEDPGQDRYLVRSYSRATAADDEVVLADLLSTIHREHFRFVGIVATNIQDAIFLIREIRDNCPDTIPFLTSSDLLYLHSDFNRDLAGTLIFSTYPLFASNQLWTWPSNRDYYRRLQFPRGESEGVYNAVLAALEGDPKLMVEYTLPFSSASEVPPLWVSVVGNDALWPVWIYPSQELAQLLQGDTGRSDESSVIFSRVREPESAKFLPPNFGMSLYPRQFDITFALVILLCTLPHLYMIKRHAMTGAHVSGLYRVLGEIIPRPPSWLARLIDDFATVNRTNRRLSLLSFVLVLLTFFIVASAVWLLPLFAMSLWTRSLVRPFNMLHENSWLLAWTIVPTLIAGLLIILGLVGFARDQYHQANQIQHQAWWKATSRFLFNEASWTAMFRFIASVIAITLALLFTISIWRQEPLQALLYFVRAANLWNGVSPLLPMLYIGFAALCLSVGELWRLSLSEEYVVNKNFLGFGDDGSFTGVGSHERAAVRLLKCSADEVPFWWLWIALPWVIYLLLDLPGYNWVAIDGRVFTWFFVAIVIFFFTALLLLFGRFIALWFELSSLLRRLYMHPTRRAYEQLRTGSVAPSMADRQRIWMVEPSDSVAAVEFCLVRVREMLRQVEPPFPASTIADRVSASRVALSELVVATQPALDAVSRYEADGEWQAAIKWKFWLQSAMSDLSRFVIEIFEPWWRLDRDTDFAATPANQPALDESLIKQAELFVASRVLDFLRQVYPQMTHLVVFVMVGLLALMLALSSYPFPHRDTFVWLSWIILLSIIGVIFVIFIQINRDRVMSMLSGTTAGELNWNGNFVWRLVMFGLIPILILLGAQFPHAIQGIVSSFGRLFAGAH